MFSLFCLFHSETEQRVKAAQWPQARLHSARRLMKRVGVPLTPPRAPAPKILAHTRGVRAVQDFANQTTGIEAESLGVLDDVLISRASWFSKRTSCISQNFPCEPAASAASAACCACGCELTSGKLRKTKPQPVAQPLLNRLEDRIGFAAIGTFVIAVFHEREGRVNRPLDMIALGVRPWSVAILG